MEINKARFEIVTIHYNTPDLLMKLYNSIRKHLDKDIWFRVIDGSDTIHYEFLHLEKRDKFFKFDRKGYNIHHGAGMHYAIQTSVMDHILIFDSDCVVLKPEILERLFSLMNNDTYAVGKIYKVLKSGMHTEDFKDFVLYLHPKTMLLNLDKYKNYHHFINHGAPCIEAMCDISERKDYHVLQHCEDLDNYVFEKGRGTVERFGYGLKKKRTKRNKVKFNILLRTSGRPNYYRNCIESIRSQTYKDYKIIVSYDDEETFNYVKGSHPDVCLKNERLKWPKPRPVEFDPYIGRRRLFAPYNLYFNNMISHCDDGYIIFLDDDDKLNCPDALYQIYHNIKTEDDLLFWRVQFPGKLIPTDDVFGGRPICCNIASNSFSFHKKHWINWDEWNLGDYRIASLLYNKLQRRIYINKPLAALQRSIANGLGIRDDLKTN